MQNGAYRRNRHGLATISFSVRYLSLLRQLTANGLVTEMAQCSTLRCAFGIWQNNEKPFISNGLGFIFTCLLTAALRVLFHLARHTYATLQIAAGTDIFTVSKMLTHKNVATTQIYAELVSEKKRETVDKISLK